MSNTKYNLFLDDIREPAIAANYVYPVELRAMYRLEHWIVLRNHKQFVDYIKRHGLPEKISFDHDLADSHYGVQAEAWALDPSLSELHEETGYDSAKWLCEYCTNNNLPLPQWFVHSANPVGAERIKHCLKNFKSNQ